MAQTSDFEWIFDHFFITKVNKIGLKRNLPYHHHAAYEMYYLASGERTFFITGSNYHVKQGDLVLIDRHDLHKAVDYEHVRRIGFLLSFQEDFLESMLDEQKRMQLLSIFKRKIIRFTSVEQSKFELLFNKMVRESTTDEAQSETYVRILLCELLILLGRKCDQTDDTDMRRNEPKDRKIEEITAYIHLHYMLKLSLDHIANMFFISKYYLSRIFKEVTGFTIVEYIRSARVLEAQKLLEGSNLNISLIAERTGFDSPTHFGRVFKECTGLSPLQYRRQFM